MTGAADVLHFATIDNEVASPRASDSCQQWNGGVPRLPLPCRLVALAGNDPADAQARAPVHYDYPSYGPGIAGSSLSFVVGTHRRDDLHPPKHAE